MEVWLTGAGCFKCESHRNAAALDGSIAINHVLVTMRHSFKDGDPDNGCKESHHASHFY
jgi:hypothetical protein